MTPSARRGRQDEGDVVRRSSGGAFRFAVALLRPPLRALTRRDWRGAEHLPPDGGFVVASNHLSYVDPLTLAHFLWDNGYPVRYLGKESVFRVPVAGRIIAAAGQIPVYRESGDAARAFAAAVEAVRAGECVGIYPEGTLTRDPDLWPMRGKTGAARVALTTGCPVIPVAQWGPQDILPPYGRRPDLLPRKTVHVWAGPPVDLSAFSDRPLDAATLRAATDTILDAVAAQLEEVRGEKAPAERWDPAAHDLPRTGNPHPHRRRP
jgi:1-acyl-sn-glycerol-3-phosphate acyltransferase